MSFNKLKQGKALKQNKKDVAEAKKLSYSYALLRAQDYAQKSIKSLNK
jgi:hypothetical protein